MQPENLIRVNIVFPTFAADADGCVAFREFCGFQIVKRKEKKIEKMQDLYAKKASKDDIERG